MSTLSFGKLQKGTVFWLALKDLRHETLINLNLILGTAAIIAPLLILFGIKFGTIETMRNRLIEDPRNLEIRQLSSQSYDKKWFSDIEKDKRVAFVMPLTRKLASTVILTTPEMPRQVKADLIPTKANDPLILRNGGVIPTGHSALLSNEAAKELNVKGGDVITMSVTRYIHQKIEKESLDLEIISILDPRASFLKTIYLPLDLAEKVEQYKDGLAVEDFGWKGTQASAYPVFDGLFITTKEPLDRVEQIRLVSGTGFSKIEQISASKALEITGYSFNNGNNIYFIQPFKNKVQETNLKAVEIKLRGTGFKAYPWIKPFPVILNTGGEQLEKFLLAGPKDWNLDVDKFYLNHLTDHKGEMVLTQQDRKLILPVALEALKFQSDFVFSDAATAGKLALFQERDLAFDPNTKSLVLARRGYAGFRLYARKLEDVEPLKHHFEQKGIAVSTQAERIHDVTTLDRYMTIIFWLIAIVGVIGGTATLSASLYSSVERKRRDLSILRLLGLSKTALFRFPVYQGSVIAVGGVSTALLFFLLMAWVINSLFGAYLGKGESFCTLTSTHIFLVLSFAATVAIISSTIAAFKATRADPAEAMRDE